MLKSCLVLFVMCFITAVSFSQSANPFVQGSWELNVSGSLGSINSSSEYKSSFGSSSSKNSDSYTYFQLCAAPAYFVSDGLAIEPELDMFFYELSKPAYSLIGNLSYTFKIADQRIAPFIKAGYGISNSVSFPVQGGIQNRVSDKLDIPILSLGAGVKFLVTDDILIRTELNYRTLSYSSSYSGYGYSSSSKYDYSFITMLFGFSVLL
jgi:hypothetical protein